MAAAVSYTHLYDNKTVSMKGKKSRPEYLPSDIKAAVFSEKIPTNDVNGIERYSYAFVVESYPEGEEIRGDYLSTIVIGKNVKNIEGLYDDSCCYFIVDPQNPYYADYHGCLYSKDYTKLIKYPAGKEPNDYHPNLQIIGSKAFYRYFWSFGKSEDVTIVIPWGVTVIEDEAFVGPETNLTYVIPDTAIRLGKASKDKEEGQRTDYYPVWVPSRHNLAAWNVWYKGSEQELSLIHI